MNSFNPIYNK